MLGKVVFVLACIMACLGIFFTFTSDNVKYEEEKQ